ncbi:MAG: hypothetical protein EP347_06695 [Alphaproteobacteria bacterium]|nr:MAG: hypothetical protein EP347_06695 [Alphaproteobacteria bacterium]
MRLVSVLLISGLVATSAFTPAIASDRTDAVNACKTSIEEKIEGEDLKITLGRVKAVRDDARYKFRVKYTNGEGERAAVNAECLASRDGEVISLEIL